MDVKATSSGWTVMATKAKEQAWAQAQSALRAITGDAQHWQKAATTSKTAAAKTAPSPHIQQGPVLYSQQQGQQPQQPSPAQSQQQYAAPYSSAYPSYSYAAQSGLPPPPPPPPLAPPTQQDQQAAYAWYYQNAPSTPTSGTQLSAPSYPAYFPPYSQPPQQPQSQPQSQTQQPTQPPPYSSQAPSFSWGSPAQPLGQQHHASPAPPPPPPPPAFAAQQSRQQQSQYQTPSSPYTQSPAVTPAKLENKWAWSTGKQGPDLLEVKVSEQPTREAQNAGTAVRFAIKPPNKKETVQASAAFTTKTSVMSDAFISASPQPTKKAKGTGISDAFKEYCLRCYGRCNNKQERQRMKTAVKAKFEEERASGKDFDWNNMEIPDIWKQPSTKKTRLDKLKKPSKTSSWQPIRRAPLQPIVGTCMDLEKEYFRIKDEVDPTTVRPEPVLREAFRHVKAKFKKGGIGYKWIWSQLKAIRQDLTVQNVRNTFTVQVYETHARIALEFADHEEFNQCQSQLNRLYKDGIPGQREEFLAYRVLEYMYKQSERDLNAVLSELSVEERKLPNIQHALMVLRAYACNNYAKFYKLYDDAPGMAPYLMDMLGERLRKTALAAICKSYRPNVALDYLRDLFKLESEDDFEKFLKDMNVESYAKNGVLDCRAATRVLG
eukprot:m.27502 g.27502  ORF g.27502 m.27502 type:complete len:660 (+) comp10261_c0_seq1:100-2079(+)